MQAMILAAGQGSRLGDRRRRPKCLRQVGGMPLVHHQLGALAAAGVYDVVIVVGYEQDKIRDAVGTRARFVVNDRFAETNSMYSFLLGHALIEDDVIVMNSDVFCHPALLGMLADLEKDAILYDSRSGDDPEQMKVCAASGQLVGMSKVMPPEIVDGENLGVLRLSRGCAAEVAAVAREMVAAGQEQRWLASALNHVARRRRIACVDVAGWPWVEIDFPTDLDRARSEIFPAIVGALSHLRSDYPDVASSLGSAS